MGKSKKHERKSKKKHKHKDHKEKKQKTKKHSKEKRNDKEEKDSKAKKEKGISPTDEKLNDFSIPLELMSNKSHAPETPEEYRQRQARMRREIDPMTGRSRLIKGDGEVLEEIVSKEEHMAINKKATKGDGDFFQENIMNKR